MARHRNVRSMNYEDEYYDDDDEDMYSRSVEDGYCISPSTADQYSYKYQERNLSSFMRHGRIEEDEEDREAGGGGRMETEEDQLQFSDLSQAQFDSCMDGIKGVLGDTFPEQAMSDAILRNNYNVEAAINDLLSLQGAPKQQRQPRQRNRSSAAAAAVGTAKPQGGMMLKSPPTPAAYRESRGAGATADAMSRLSIDPASRDSEEPATQKSASQTPKTPAKGAGIKQEPVSVNGSAGDSVPDSGTPSAGATAPTPIPATPKREALDRPMGIPKSGSKTKERINYQEEFKSRHGNKEQISLVVIGHVDAGKSTLMGHLLHQLGAVNKKTMHKYEQESRKIGKSSFAYAWVLDETAEERERGVTMDVAEREFQTDKRIVTLLDAPGHKDFIPNMITGAAQADVAVLVINATKGEFETGFDAGGQTREHTLLARSLGVGQLIVAVNKMDTVDWSKERYDVITQKMGQFLRQATFKDKDVSFVPCSGLLGENLVTPSKEPQLTSWYSGPTLVQLIDQFQTVERPIDKPFRMCVADIFKGQTGGISVAGRIGAGHVQPSDRVLVCPGGHTATVKTVLINEGPARVAFAGDSVSLTLNGIDSNHLNVGCVVCDPFSPPKSATRISARIVLFNLARPLTRCKVVFHYQAMQEQANICKLVAQLNRSTGEVVQAKPKCLLKNTSAIVHLEFERPVCVELYKEFKELGRFTLRSDGVTIAAGLIEEVLQEKNSVVVEKGLLD